MSPHTPARAQLAWRSTLDGIILKEHNNTQISMNTAPNLTAAARIPQTKGWINVFGTPPNLGYANRLAEDTPTTTCPWVR